MNLNEYQLACRETAIYPQSHQIEGLNYTLMGLGGEVGEMQNKFKKVLRGDHGNASNNLTATVRDQLINELGDVFWYIAETATQLGATLNHVAQLNIDKQHQRQKENKLKGEGDNR